MRCTLLTRRSMGLYCRYNEWHGLSNKMRTPGYSQRRLSSSLLLVLANTEAMALYMQYITNKTECFSFKGGYIVRVFKTRQALSVSVLIVT